MLLIILGERPLRNVTGEHGYLHAIEKGKSRDATVLRVLISALSVWLRRRLPAIAQPTLMALYTGVVFLLYKALRSRNTTPFSAPPCDPLAGSQGRGFAVVLSHLV